MLGTAIVPHCGGIAGLPVRKLQVIENQLRNIHGEYIAAGAGYILLYVSKVAADALYP
jgi:hypothetical protein